jgi:hypothetical protein
MTKQIGYGAFMLAALAGAANAQFNNGNLVLLEANQNSGGTLVATAAAVTLRGYQPGSGLTGFNVLIPNGNFGQRATIGGSSTSEGLLQLSADGSTLLFGGYDAARGAGSLVGGGSFPTSTGSIANSLTTQANRMAVGVSRSGTVTLNAISDTFSGGNIRTPASISGATFFNIASRDGVRFLDPSAGTTTTAASAGSPALTNIRVAEFSAFNVPGVGPGQLMLSASSTAGGLNGLGWLNQSTGTVTPLPGMSNVGGSVYDFVFTDADTVYMADDSSTSTNGGIRRFDFDAGTGTWVQSYRMSTGLNFGLRSLTYDPATGTFYAIQAAATAGAATSLVSVIDTGAGSSFTTLATAAAGTTWRGVQFIPTPGAAALMGLGGLAMARRRRSN